MKLKCIKGFDYNNLYWLKGKYYEVDWYSDVTITLIDARGRWAYFIYTDYVNEGIVKMHDARGYFDLTPVKLDGQLILIREEIGL